MKLSDIKGERAIEVIADIIDPIANIAEGEAAKELFTKKPLPQGMTARDFAVKRARKSVPGLLKAHKSDIISILATIEGVSPAEYTGILNLAKLMKDCYDLITDEAFITLFTSAQTGESSSGSALANTAGGASMDSAATV